MVMGKNIKTTPAGKNDKIDINVISLVQIVENEKENINSQNLKTVVTNSAKIQGILSNDLDLGVVIKVENGGRPADRRNNITMTKGGKTNITMTKGRESGIDKDVI